MLSTSEEVQLGSEHEDELSTSSPTRSLGLTRTIEQAGCSSSRSGGMDIVEKVLIGAAKILLKRVPQFIPSSFPHLVDTVHVSVACISQRPVRNRETTLKISKRRNFDIEPYFTNDRKGS